MLPLKAAPDQFGPTVRTLGLQVWRVEKMKAVPLDQTEVGSFYNGDSYLVLDNRGEMGADIHMWIGESREDIFTISGGKSKGSDKVAVAAQIKAPILHVWDRSRSLRDASAVSVWLLPEC